MKPTRFLIHFSLFIIFFAILIFGGIHQLEIFEANQLLSIIGFALFSVYTIATYFLGVSSAKSANKHLFTQIHLGSIFLKMLLTIILLMIYRKFYEPDSVYYIVPFIIVYVVFTIYETYIMMKISKGEKPSGGTTISA